MPDERAEGLSADRSPARLWAQAEAKWPNDVEARRACYLRLMTEAGNLVAREPGDESPMLPCGYEPRGH